MYSWGLDRMGSTGLPIKKEQYNKQMNRIIKEPRQVVFIAREFEKNKEKNRLISERDNINFKTKIKQKEVQDILPNVSEQDEEDKIDEDEEEEKIVTEKEDKKSLHKNIGKGSGKATNTKQKDGQQVKRKDAASKHSKSRVPAKIRPVSEEDINIPRMFIQTSNIRSISLSKADKFHGLHKYLVDELNNKCDEQSIIRLNKRLSKFLMLIIDMVKTAIDMSNERYKQELKIEASFISRVADKPF
jgi:hypothetical protein